ncbi:EF-hand and coiled-coil domain-containing protein 1-like isoform X1 [Leucoraja erinacea]|uniref:EF-hand and coiled-coil domain-containing protein 1-like isoform X1 n=1 Tax=Leucoraja erinaceus TaxID=7782 RepID=UPI00245486BF|nr:EF-hand and coiled-coil domain-containing protein 1-like isoform X1 [Leucoraja erinacea]
MWCCSEPLARPARRSAWIVGALTHYFGSDGAQEDNEIVVLATGADQYLQEIFHHLSYQGDGLVSAEDFRLLCSVLDLVRDEEGQTLLSGLPDAVTFRQFHARLCGYFHRRAGENAGRLPVGKETEHIERQIRLRCPRRRRKKKCVSFDLSKGWGESQVLGRSGPDLQPGPNPAGDGEASPSALELENASLRELVEDLRGALQGSDARCLALQVALQKVYTCPGKEPPERRETPVRGCPGFRSVLRELQLIRESRDGQILEAMRFNQQLEEEMKRAHGLLARWEQSVATLRGCLAQVRRKAERARSQLLDALEKVRLLEAEAKRIPVLQRRVEELERCRSQGDQSNVVSAAGNPPQDARKPGTCSPSPIQHQARISPAGKAESAMETGIYCGPQMKSSSCNGGEDRLLRAVEGRAASDEEEERGSEEQPCPMPALSGDGCSSADSSPSSTLRRLLSCNGSGRRQGRGVVVSRERGVDLTAQLENKEQQVTKLRADVEQLACSMTKELQLKGEEVEMLRMEVQMVEADRVRLSLVEEKLTDVLQLLQQLRLLNISRRALGKMLLSTLGACYQTGHGTMASLDMLNVLHKELVSCELLGKDSSRRESQQVLKTSLVITC